MTIEHDVNNKDHVCRSYYGNPLHVAISFRDRQIRT